MDTLSLITPYRDITNVFEASWSNGGKKKIVSFDQKFWSGHWPLPAPYFWCAPPKPKLICKCKWDMNDSYVYALRWLLRFSIYLIIFINNCFSLRVIEKLLRLHKKFLKHFAFFQKFYNIFSTPHYMYLPNAAFPSVSLSVRLTGRKF